MRCALVTTVVLLGAPAAIDVPGAHLVLAVHAREIVAPDEGAS